ncbi:MAG: hypothetical protein FWC36_03050 [Spirochaetes bacterium]|nr:hypothetical protein [Spirochaetota bacterium]
MATINPRINITVTSEIAGILNKVAKQNKKSKSKVALELIEWAIEEKEDMYFSKIADEREQSNPKWIKDNDKIWK